MKALSLFSGIGGLDLAAEMAGIKVVAFCEIEPYPISILEKRYLGIPIYNDIRQLKGSDFNDRIDVVHGGFPCQDLSCAGKQKGLEGERSGLWFEMLRIISEVRPRFVLAENVRGAVNLALDTVKAGLEQEGYKVWAFVIPASAVGAPHQRERLFVVGVREDVADALNERLQGGEWSEAFRGKSSSPSEPAAECGESGGALWPTPREFMYKDSVVDRGKGNIGEKVGGQLNPDWVEQLMNYPEGWTDLDVDETREWAGWPALLGQEQYPYEFPRTATGCKNRAKRLKALGNSVVPAQAYPFFKAIVAMENSITEGMANGRYSKN